MKNIAHSMTDMKQVVDLCFLEKMWCCLLETDGSV